MEALRRILNYLTNVPLLLLIGCGLSAEETYHVHGVVHAVDPADKQIQIEHEDIPGFMPAMTMNFDVASAQLIEGVEPGARVSFELERSATTLRITALEVLGGSAGVASVAAAQPPDLEVAPDFELTDQRGSSFALSDLRGSVVLLDFIFTRCTGPCPILTAAHAELQQRLPSHIAEKTHFISISIDPEYDTPERLRAYGETRGADLGSWSFLTGSRPAVQAVLDDYYIGTTRARDGTLNHVVVTYLIDPQGLVVRRYVGLEHPLEEILAKLEEILS